MLETDRPDADFPVSTLQENYRCFHAYAAGFAQNVEEEYLYISSTADPVITLAVLTSTYHDIRRYKLYHQKDFHRNKSDAAKRAAYYAKWILRFRPIVIRHKQEYEAVASQSKDVSLWVNECFALHWGLDNIAAELGVAGLRLKEQPLINTLYDLHYRELSGDALIAMFTIFSDLAKGSDNSIIERSVR